MSERKKSTFLVKMIENAKQIGETRNPPFTAERFFVAIINALQSDDPDIPQLEMKLVGSMLRKTLVDLDVAKKALLEHINGTSTTFMDDLYMKKKLRQAEELAEKANARSVDAISLFLQIRKDPSEAIKAVMVAPVDKPEEQETPASQPEETVQEEEAPSAVAYFDNALEEAAVSAKSNIAQLVADVKRIRSELKSAVYGQDNAINVFATGYFQASLLSMIDKSRKRPRATFLFAGPPGVGKTFLAEQIADALKLPFRRFDMSEYVDKEANIEFCGSDKVYKNGKAGNVTSFVAENPKCVVLFDEIEKANIRVIHLFLQMLDAGRLRDNYTDEEVSFQDTIIILTTNAGKQLYEESESGDFSSVPRKVIIQALQKDVNPASGAPYFPGAICSRFASGNVVMFNQISANNLRQIAKKEIQRHASSFEAETGIKIQVDDRVYTALLLAEGSAADARTIRSRAETFFNDELYELLRLISSEKVHTGIDAVEKIRITVDLSRTKEEISELFAAAGKTSALVFAAPDTVIQCQNKAPAFDIVGAQKPKTAIEAIKSKEIAFVLLDMRYGAPAPTLANLNMEDVESPARAFFKFLREQKADIPVYLLAGRDAALSEEEKVSFLRQGVRGEITMGPGFGKELDAIAVALHQQASMAKLAKANKLVTFETAQTISKKGKSASIKLFDFEMGTAVDAEDAKNVLSAVATPDVHFDDIIGAEDAKKELTYFVEYLKNPKKYMGTGVKAPKGVLLYGPPGTGKTMLAKAMACEAGVTFIAAEGNEFLKRYVGEGSARVHELFKTARKYAPAILFIDEIDAIARERRGGTNGNSGNEETLTAFLTEMDGFVTDPTKPVFVLAATNFDVEPGGDKSLDPALMRRFDRRVYIDLPDKEDRMRFLKLKIQKNRALDISDAQVENIAVRATGMSLAELDSAVELALRSAIREGSTTVNDVLLEEAFETFHSGEVKAWDVSQLERVARHEAGHAFLCWHSGETPSYLTIVARGNHGGYMQHAEQEGKAIFTKDELLSRIRTALGGRAAELVYYGDREGISTGASGDLVSATNLAQKIVCAYGMDDDFGLAVFQDTMSAEVRASVNRILKEQMGEAVRLISENKEKINALVEALLQKNHMNGAQINEILL